MAEGSARLSNPLMGFGAPRATDRTSTSMVRMHRSEHMEAVLFITRLRTQ